MKNWKEVKPILKAFIRVVKPSKIFDGQSEYVRGYNSALNKVTSNTNRWFEVNDRLNK